MIRRLKLAIIALALFTINCGAQDITQKNGDSCDFKSVQNLNPGLTVYKASGGELCGSYRSGENAIHFQAVRGEDLVYGVNTADLDAPPYAVSVRIIDRDGNPIAIAFGDRDTKTANWMSKLNLGNTGPDLNSTFALAQEATEVLSQTGLTGFDEEIKTLKRRSFTAAPEVNSPDQQLNKAQALLSTWRYSIQILRKGAFIGSNPYADHSALLVNETSPEGMIVNYVTCNHGTCADQPSMLFKCSKLVYPTGQRFFYDDMCSVISTYGFTAGHYVCNDSTLLEYNIITTGNSSTATCNDASLRYYAPDCN